MYKTTTPSPPNIGSEIDIDRQRATRTVVRTHTHTYTLTPMLKPERTSRILIKSQTSFKKSCINRLLAPAVSVSDAINAPDSGVFAAVSRHGDS